jgi:hypothetical protein
LRQGDGVVAWECGGGIACNGAVAVHEIEAGKVVELLVGKGVDWIVCKIDYGNPCHALKKGFRDGGDAVFI